MEKAKGRKKGGDWFAELLTEELGAECVTEYRFHPVRKWRFDYAVPSLMVALEVEGGCWVGGRHTRGAGFKADMEKYNTAATLGWTVLRCTPDQKGSAEITEAMRKAAQAKRREPVGWAVKGDCCLEDGEQLALGL